MSSLTAVELGEDTCALARTAVRQGDVRLTAAELLDPAAFPGADAFVTALRQARRGLKLPRRARVVLWGVADGASRQDPLVKPLLVPLTAAGFRVERVVSPCNALAALARLRTPRAEGATCWLTINRGGVALVVVRPGRQLYAHSFIWDSTVGAVGSQARLLQRYTQVATLAPEVRRAMAAARTHGTPVLSLVTCGNLPDLRSLTMPLIEELDLEVETLDSLEGLAVRPEMTDRFTEIAPAIRIACAGALARASRPRREGPAKTPTRTRAIGAALAAGVIGVAAFGWHEWMLREAPAARTRPPIVAPPKPSTPAVAATTKPTPSPGAPPITAPVVRTPPLIVAPPKPSTSAASTPSKPAPSSIASPITAAVSRTPPPNIVPSTSRAPATNTAPNAVRPSAGPPSNSPLSKTPSTAQPPRPSPVAAPPPPARLPLVTSRPPARSNPPPGHPAVDAAPQTTDIPDARRPARKTTPALLTDALPNVTAILVSSDRRLATVAGGHIIGVGDAVGRRVVTAVDDRSVVLREPSGVQIRVGLGGVFMGVVPEID